MITPPMSSPIATKQLQFRRSDGSTTLVRVTLGIPIPDPSDPMRTWACPYEIEAFGDVETRAIFGGDSLQALILTLHTLPAELQALARDNNGEFLDSPDLGLDHACRTRLEYAG